jgi:hypothetical protein
MDTADGELCYEVQYLESDRSHNYVHARPADEIKFNYPIDTTWREKVWRLGCQLCQSPNVWNTDSQATKRTFEDTPEKAQTSNLVSTSSNRTPPSTEFSKVEQLDVDVRDSGATLCYEGPDQNNGVANTGLYQSHRTYRYYLALQL